MTSVDSLLNFLLLSLCIIHQDQALQDQAAQAKAEMETAAAAHVRGLLPHVSPSLPDAQMPNPYFDNVQSSRPVGCSCPLLR